MNIYVMVAQEVTVHVLTGYSLSLWRLVRKVPQQLTIDLPIQMTTLGEALHEATEVYFIRVHEDSTMWAIHA